MIVLFDFPRNWVCQMKDPPELKILYKWSSRSEDPVQKVVYGKKSSNRLQYPCLSQGKQSSKKWNQKKQK